MAYKKKQTGADIDWYLISIDRLKQIGLVVLLLVFGLAGYWFWQSRKASPKTTAEAAIAEARQSLNSLAASQEFAAHRSEFNRAQQKLEEAVTHFDSSRFPEAREAAVESQTVSQTALAGATDIDSDAQFLAVEGDVRFQKGASSEWRNADVRTTLVNGDWVKTGERASAELIFSNGSLYTIGSNALLEIFSAVNPGSTRKTGAVQMKIGSVEVSTKNESSTVRTPGAQVVVESESATQVGVGKAEDTSVVTVRGAASVATPQGGTPVRVAAGEKVSATAQGSLSPVKKLVMPPALLSPGDNQVFQLSPELRVELLWQPQAGATAYVLQVSRSRLFSTREIHDRRTRSTATATVTSEGSYFWRVASVGPDGDVGPFSSFRRFRVSSGSKGPSSDRTPPVLTLKAPFHVGGQFYTIAGSTEPGATVFINDEEVDVESGGAFQKLVGFGKIGRNDVVVKAIDPSGNQTVQSQIVFVEE